ncbi:HAD family phosphatase [Roseovarius sp. SCSIO 43702]|uniref:HAD family hydrolase n=1 Tax=Roseovarius sp. SCSIO 43702 TaxID=2823043 RepID=UPI001C7374D2|nr:HAD family phosphatase [Roseovarius sp. SCSIO 43702]QYX56650.1 HAD family phosphatase [Roseovarius sp. SCSIO 43702]
MTVRAVIFDIGNVLIRWHPEGWFDARIGPARRASLFGAVDIHAMMQRIDAGAPFGATIEETAIAHPGWTAEIRAIRDHWTEIAQPAIDGSVRLLHALRRAGVPVFALSNFGAENFPLSEAQFPFLRDFDRRYISGRMGLAKPDPAIFAAVEADCGLPPETLLFTDDRADNIAAARARGWRTHLFTTPDALAACLTSHDLITEEQIT